MELTLLQWMEDIDMDNLVEPFLSNVEVVDGQPNHFAKFVHILELRIFALSWYTYNARRSIYYLSQYHLLRYVKFPFCF